MEMQLYMVEISMICRFNLLQMKVPGYMGSGPSESNFLVNILDQYFR
jgi:hypothetical protein